MIILQSLHNNGSWDTSDKNKKHCNSTTRHSSCLMLSDNCYFFSQSVKKNLYLKCIAKVNVSRAHIRLSWVSLSGWGECIKGLSNNNTTREWCVCVYAFALEVAYHFKPDLRVTPRQLTLLKPMSLLFLGDTAMVESQNHNTHPKCILGLTLRNNLLP